MTETTPRTEIGPAAFPPVSDDDVAILQATAVMFADLGRELKTAAQDSSFEALTRVAVARVPGAQSASVTTLRGGQFRTESATDERALGADLLQYELGSGPCVDAIIDGTLYHPVDLRHDERWPEYGRRANAEFGVVSMASYRLAGDFLAEEMIAGLNLYSDQPDAFSPAAVGTGLLLATHAAALVAAQLNRDKVENLEHALATSRDIGVAMGVLMARYRLSREQAIDLLRITSQRSNRKLRDIAVEVGDTGVLRDLPT
jgi:hypothetical protein